MQKKFAFTATCVLSLLTLYACNDNDESIVTSPPLTTDVNPNSCLTTASDGSNVVVGSNQVGDPAFPEPASGARREF